MINHTPTAGAWRLFHEILSRTRIVLLFCYDCQLLSGEDIKHGLPYGFHRSERYILHRVVDRMPCRTERALCAVGIIWHYIYARYAGSLVDRHMVVGNRSAVFLREY